MSLKEVFDELRPIMKSHQDIEDTVIYYNETMKQIEKCDSMEELQHLLNAIIKRAEEQLNL